ncbi:Lrp/AsnC family transcriptional regulator [Candidatus Bathyarchaeota archaeon]|nr:Lrp/AsnC family transcriptional regulator [Candidatus Bathyarchaeota archaeon]MBS7617019.1 Lrp/AsnC family transcriptional regulator [Candidatus Bathyarchaeota archaeon]
MNLNDLDKKILIFLQNDARLSFVKIAKQLGVSEGTVHLRVKKLIKEGVIKGFYTVLDPDKIGLPIRAFIGLQADPSLYESILKKLSEIDGVYGIYDITGEFSALIDVKVGSKKELTEVIDQVGAIPGVKNTVTMLVLRVLKEELGVAIR